MSEHNTTIQNTTIYHDCPKTKISNDSEKNLPEMTLNFGKCTRYPTYDYVDHMHSTEIYGSSI